MHYKNNKQKKMSQLTSASLTAMMLLLLAAAAVATTAAPAGSSCQSNIDVLKTTCYEYVEKGTPMAMLPLLQECCDAMKGVDVPCVCTYLGTPGIKESISLKKVFHVTQQCGVSIPWTCGAAATTAGSGCQSDIDMLKTTCYKYVEKVAPTVLPPQECCDALKGVDMPRVCSYVGTPGIKENISMEKVFYVTRQCGISIPRNCGGSKQA